MADRSPILLIVDPQTNRFSSLNERLLPVLNYVQTRYSVVLLAKRQGGGALAFPAVPHARNLTRSLSSAAGAFRNIDFVGRAVHLCAPDIDRALLETVFYLVDKGVHFSVLSELCGSVSGERVSRAWISCLKLSLGETRVVRACEYVPAERFGFKRAVESSVLGDERQGMVSKLLCAVDSFEHLSRLSEMLMLDDGTDDRGTGLVSDLKRPSDVVPVTRAYTGRRSGRPGVIDSYTSEALYRLAAEPAPNGFKAWSADMLARQLYVRGMAFSVSSEGVGLHFEENERNCGVPNPIGVTNNQACLDLTSVAAPRCVDGSDVAGVVEGISSGAVGVEPEESSGVVAPYLGTPSESALGSDGPSEVGDVWMPLSGFRADERPAAVKIPNGTVKQLDFWCEILYSVVDWLLEEGLVSSSNCPVRLGRSEVPIIDTVRPAASVGRNKGGYRELPDGMYLRTKSNRHEVIENSKALLRQFGGDPSSFRLRLA